MSGNFLSCLKGVKDSFEAPEGRWISLEMPPWKRASCCIEGKSLGFSGVVAGNMGFLLGPANNLSVSTVILVFLSRQCNSS